MYFASLIFSIEWTFLKSAKVHYHVQGLGAMPNLSFSLDLGNFLSHIIKLNQTIVTWIKSVSGSHP